MQLGSLLKPGAIMFTWMRDIPKPWPRVSADEWQDPYDERIYEGELLVWSLRNEARRATRLASIAKASLVVLGALTATKAVFDDLAGPESAGVIIIYALFGVLIAAIAGLLAAFKWDERAAQLTVLASQVTSSLREIETEWETKVLRRSPEDPSRGDAIRRALARQDATLRDFELKAAELDVMVEKPVETPLAAESTEPSSGSNP
jgi:hypothetical protein